MMLVYLFLKILELFLRNYFLFENFFFNSDGLILEWNKFSVINIDYISSFLEVYIKRFLFFIVLFGE